MQPLSTDEIVRLGKEIYARDLRDRLEPCENGKYVVIDVDTREYEIDQELIQALRRLKAGKHEPRVFIGRVGSPTAVKIGGAVSATA